MLPSLRFRITLVFIVIISSYILLWNYSGPNLIPADGGQEPILGIVVLLWVFSILFGMDTVKQLFLSIEELTQEMTSPKQKDKPDQALFNRSDHLGVIYRKWLETTERLNSQIDHHSAEEEKFAAILQTMTDGIIMVDENWDVRLINPAAEKMFHTHSKVALGHSLIEVVRQHQVIQLWNECVESKQQQSISFETTPDRIFIQAYAMPLASATTGHGLLFFQDITRQQKLEIIRRDFVSNVSHELRTPLASLKSLVETLLDGAMDDKENAQRFLIRMEKEIDNMTQLVQELLELSRIESGRVPLSRRWLAPQELVQVAMERLQMQAERAGLVISADIPDDLPKIFIDLNRMGQVMMNLIHNAIKFTPSGGEILLSIRQSGNNMVFSVKDTGSGIAADSLPRIFERFYKEDRARSGGGTGLGLSIAKHLVETHGGNIWVESIPGKGSIFYFSIPIGI